MSDTPETDEQFKSFPAYFEIDLFCRKLERERDELQKAINGLCDHLGVSPANTTLLAVEVLRIERELYEARKDAAQLADRLSGVELATTEELAKMEQERNASRELAIAFHNDQTNLILLLQEWKDMAAKLVNIASYALGEFDVQLTLDQQRNITETMREYHSLLKKQ